MEFIIPLFLLFILSVVAAAATMRATTNWAGGRGIVIITALFMPGLYVAYLLGISHLRDDYHRRRSQTYNFDGNCVVALGHGYRLEFYDEFPAFSKIILGNSGTAGNYLDDGSLVRLLENGVQRVGVTNLGVYGAASGRDDYTDNPIAHFFWISFADGSVRRFRTEAELRSAVASIGPMNSSDELFSIQESKERSALITWAMFVVPVFAVVLGCYKVGRRQSAKLSEEPQVVRGATH